MLIHVADEVIILAGADKGTRGKVLKVNRKARKVVVEGVNRVFKHVRKSQRNPQGGQLSKEMPVDVSNVMIIDPSNNLPTRIGVRYLADGTKERYAKKSGASLGRMSPARTTYAKGS